jgi:hypothetical protein
MLFLLGGKYYLVMSPEGGSPIELDISVDNKDSDENKGDTAGDGKTKEGQASKTVNVNEFKSKFGIDKEWNDLIENLADTKDLQKNFPEIYDEIKYNSGVTDSYIFRKRHFEDLIVKEVFPTLHNVDKPFEQILQEASVDLNKYNERNEIIHKFRKWSTGELAENRPTVRITKQGQNLEQKPLSFPREERKKYLDSTLKETKETQLYNFMNRYFNYDPDKGDLPAAVRDLYYDNLQRMVFSFSDDQTYLFIDYFDENLNKEDFLKNSLYQASRLKKTKTQTELLFAIENIYEIQQRAWQHFFKFENMYKNLPDDKKNRLRIETLRRIRERYKPLLENKKIQNYDDAIKVYGKKREEILDYITRNTPDKYRVTDALFEKGRLHWDMGVQLKDEGQKKKAIEIWKNISVNPGSKPDEITSSETIQKLKPIIETYERFNNPGLVERQIQNIIDQRQAPRLMEKIKREEKILWPK